MQLAKFVDACIFTFRDNGIYMGNTSLHVRLLSEKTDTRDKNAHPDMELEPLSFA